MVASGEARFYPSALMRGLIRICIRIYQLTLSPLLTGIAGGGCRFDPTCSEYFLQAVDAHGAWKGSFFGIKRILRCHPWGGAGDDPVPRVEIADRCV
jgi:putative membrane protein insertion efficiency factor